MMELKKFEAPTLAEALQVIKRELGPEAVILSTKNKKSSLGLLNKSSVEVTATVSSDALSRKHSAESRMTAEKRSELERQPTQKVLRAYDVLSGARLTREMNARSAPASQPTPARSMTAPAPRTAHTMTQRRYVDITDEESPAEQASARSADRAQFSEDAYLGQRTSRTGGPVSEDAYLGQRTSRTGGPVSEDAYLGQRTSRTGGPVSSAAASFSRAAAAASNFAMPQSAPQVAATLSSGIPGILQKLMGKAIEAGIEADLVRELGDELKVVMIREHLTREDHLKLRFARILMSRLRVARPLSERIRVPTNPRIICFVGPTGVGKTTTVAKIAAEMVLHQKKQVTFATTDTFKIAAVEQLQTYASILKVPLEVCPTAEALEQLAAQAGPDEIILVDTAGYGPKDEKRLTEMRELLASVRAEVHLCVAATTRDSDLREITRRFKMFDPGFLVVTKLDETSTYGNIFNVCTRSLLPLSYFTMGQRVPEDIEVATRERLADLILDIAEGDDEWTKQIS